MLRSRDGTRDSIFRTQASQSEHSTYTEDAKRKAPQRYAQYQASPNYESP